MRHPDRTAAAASSSETAARRVSSTSWLTARADRPCGQGRRPADEVGQHLLPLPAQGPHLRPRQNALRLPHPHPELDQPPDRVRRLPGQAVHDPGGGGGPPQRVDGRSQVLVPVRAGLPGQLVPASGEALRRRAVQLVEDAVEIHRAIVPPVTSRNGVPRRAAGTRRPQGPTRTGEDHGRPEAAGRDRGADPGPPRGGGDVRQARGDAAGDDARAAQAPQGPRRPGHHRADPPRRRRGGGGLPGRPGQADQEGGRARPQGARRGRGDDEAPRGARSRRTPASRPSWPR